MTSRERIQYVLSGALPDRVPVSLYRLNPFSANGFLMEHPSCAHLLESARNLQDTFQFYKPKTGFFFSAPNSVELKVEETQDSQISHLVNLQVDTPLGPLTRTVRNTRLSSVDWVQKPWVEHSVDIRKFLTLPYSPYEPDLTDFYEMRNTLGDKGLMVVVLPSALGVVGTLFAPGDFARFVLDYASLVQELLDKVQERLINLYTYLSTRLEGQIIRIRGAEYATPPALPREYFHAIKRLFSDYVIRRDHQLIEILRRGMRNSICYHWHDQEPDLLPMVLKLEPDIIEPVCNSYEAPNTVQRVRKAVGEHMILMGGIVSEDLEFRSREEVRSMVKDVLLQGARKGRFIFIPSDIPTSVPVPFNVEENYLEFLESGVKFGVYPMK